MPPKKRTFRKRRPRPTEEDFKAALEYLNVMVDHCDFSIFDWPLAEQFVRTSLAGYYEKGFLTYGQIRKAIELYKKWKPL